MYPIKTDDLKKCENYRKARENSGVKGFHDIRLADKDTVVWQKKSSTIGGNRDMVPRINKHGGTSRNGWIGKQGFNQHT